MRLKLVGPVSLLLGSLLSFTLSAPRAALAANDSTAAASADYVGPELQQEISQVLWGCYAVGEELVGSGDVQAAKSVLRECYASDMVFEAILPPAYSALNFVTDHGADGFVDTSNAFYRALNLVYVQHLITNIVIKRSGPNRAIVKSAALAIHTFADNHVFNANVGFDINLQRTAGGWKMTHVTMKVHSVTQEAAWVPPGAPVGG